MKNKSLTLFEVLLVLTIISIIIGFSFYFFNFFSQSNFVFEETLNNLVKFIETAKEKSKLGENDANWGVVFVNSTTKNLVQIVKNNSTNIVFVYDLPNFVIYLDPPNNSSKLIFFEKFTGKTTSTKVLLKNKNTGLQKYICIPTSSPSFVSPSSTCYEF